MAFSAAKNGYRTVLFDLDGTLLDTAPDLANSLNHVLSQNGRDTLPYETIRPWVSHGGLVMIHKAFNIEPNHPKFEALRDQLLEHYRANIAIQTRLFDGMETVLIQLETRDIQWGVVTNKPAWLTEPLLQELGLMARCACVVSGDTLAERKPHPAPLRHACELTNSQIDECLYIGDAQRDIEAGKNAGMGTLVALFGYIDDQDDPESWQADAMINHPLEILDWISNQLSCKQS